jgi:hypothetical protein
MRELAPKYSNQDMADGYSDEDYYSKNKKRTTAVRKKPYKVNEKTRLELKKAGFPEKYIKFLERCINTQVKGKKPPVTELIAQGGAGQIQSQFGEVMAMAFMLHFCSEAHARGGCARGGTQAVIRDGSRHASPTGIYLPDTPRSSSSS